MYLREVERKKAWWRAKTFGQPERLSLARRSLHGLSLWNKKWPLTGPDFQEAELVGKVRKGE